MAKSAYENLPTHPGKDEDLDVVEFEDDALDLHNVEGNQLEKRQKTAIAKKKAGRTRGGARSLGSSRR